MCLAAVLPSAFASCFFVLLKIYIRGQWQSETMGRTKTRLTGLERKNIYVGIEGKRRIKTAGSAYVQGQTEQGPGQSMGDSLL